MGIEDELYGEVPVAAVVLKQGCNLTLSQLQQFLRDKLAGYKIPVDMLILNAIPLTAGNKADKRKLKELFYERRIKR